MLSTAVAGQVRDSVPEAVKVLFVEDDTDFREALAGELSDHGFATQCFGDGESLITALEQCLEADLILLDWSLPRTSGIELVQELRERGIELPVVFLTGHSPTLREAQAFDRGAMDFIDKVRGVDVLVRRLRRATKMAKPPVPEVPTEQALVHGNLVLRSSIGRAYWNGTDIELTLSEYKIVSRLTSNIGRGPQDLDRAAPADASAVAAGANVDRYARGGRPHRNGGRPADRRRPLHPCRRTDLLGRDGDGLVGAEPGRCRDPVLRRLLLPRVRGSRPLKPGRRWVHIDPAMRRHVAAPPSDRGCGKSERSLATSATTNWS